MDKDELERAKKGFQDQIQGYRKDDLKKKQIESIISFLKDKNNVSIEEIARQVDLPIDYVRIRVEELILIGRLNGTFKEDVYSQS